MWNKKYPYTKEEVQDFSSSLYAESNRGRIPLTVSVELAVNLALFWFTVEKQYGK